MKNLSTNTLEELECMYQRILAIIEDEFIHVSDNCPDEIKTLIHNELDKIAKSL